ncbi:zinc finger protein 300-like [Uloborus diversus]|uniref:zinc finger protein 300-like n=1 Tax=Uloborus diversus TaxID=327109 RepID=UPI00240A37A5|nr:zinc finger protein 300-like [Uloborus diversus]
MNPERSNNNSSFNLADNWKSNLLEDTTLLVKIKKEDLNSYLCTNTQIQAAFSVYYAIVRSLNKVQYSEHLLIHIKDCIGSFAEGNFESKKDQSYYQFDKSAKELYGCEPCNEEFSTKELLWKHSLCHLDHKLLKCNICSRKFSQKSSLVRHYECSLTTGKPHVCAVCQKRFKQSFMLKRHIVTHKDEKPYICNVCQKPFKCKSTLLSHSIIHTNEKPYHCNVCNMSFKRRGDLSNHRSHARNREKPCL